MQEEDWPFNVVIDRPFQNVEKIFPTQQKALRELLDNVIKDDVAKKIIVFGSSVNSSCNPWSDIDILIEYNCNKKRSDLKLPKDQAFDIIELEDLDEDLESEINELGVIIYEKRDVIR